MDEALQWGAVVVARPPLGCSGSVGVAAGCGWWSRCPGVAELEVTSSPPHPYLLQSITKRQWV